MQALLGTLHLKAPIRLLQSLTLWLKSYRIRKVHVEVSGSDHVREELETVGVEDHDWSSNASIEIAYLVVALH